jgi:SagB-type dehydrogenase family enzyme
MSLEEALFRRRSVREFSGQSLDEGQIGQLLWAAQGISSAEGFRTAPSAGALYALEIYVATAAGVDHYLPKGHEIERLSTDDARPALFWAAFEQEPVRSASAVFVIAVIYGRLAGKYGKARATRYAQLEAGHAAQNLMLQAVALGLGSVPIGAFDDEQVRSALALPADRLPVYLIPVGPTPR